MRELLQANVLLPWLLGMLFGIFVGATPGLTATMAVALVIPISFHLPETAGLALIIGVSFTAIFAGDIPAVHLRIPGTPASAAAALDGYPLAQRGEGSLVLLLDLICSAIGGAIGVLLLILAAPWLARFALQFSFHEKFWLGVLGLSLSALVSRGSLLRGIMAAAAGVLISTAGSDIVSGAQRLTFGRQALFSGIPFIPAMIGLFGMSEFFRYVCSGRTSAALSPSKIPTQGGWKLWLKALAIVVRHPLTVLQSAVTGTVIGALPGAGADIAAWGAYGLAQKTSRRGEHFGEGEIEGVIAPTSANNAAVGGAWIPALVFGVPGDAVTAIVLGALMMYNITPGPNIFENNAQQIEALFAAALITQVLLIPAGGLGVWAFGWLMRLPRSLVMTAVATCSVVGAYALHNSMTDVYVMLAFGLLGFYLESRRIPIAPLILGLILGPMVEENWRTGLIRGDGDWTLFFTRPLCGGMFALWLLAILGPLAARLTAAAKKKEVRSPEFEQQ